jgi:transposase
MDRDGRINRAGNSRARKTMVQLVWLWLRYQPESRLARWFRARVGELMGRTRRIAIVAMARTARRNLAVHHCGRRAGGRHSRSLSFDRR